MTQAYTHVNLADVDDSAPAFGFGEVQEARFATRQLQAERTGISYHRLKPGRRSAFGHRHDEAEEVYVILAGSGRIKLDHAILDVRQLDAIRIAPRVTRALEAGESGLEWLAVGPRHEGDGELRYDWWTD